MIPARARFLSLIATNLRRHRVRALIGVAGITFGVAAMMTILGIVNGAIGMFERILSTDSHCLVFEKNVSDLFFSSVRQEQIAVFAADPLVAEAHPLLFGIVSSPGHPIITCFGVEATDPRITRATWLAGSPAAFTATSNDIFLGSRAAEFLSAKLGSELPIGKGQFRVAGILRTENGFEDGGVFLPLSAAQTFFHREGVASIVAITLHDRTRVPEFRYNLELSHPDLMVLENREFSQSYTQFRILHLTAWAVGVCAFLLGGLGVANTMLLSVFSRIREIAILRVCGFSSLQIVALIFGEASAVAGTGLLLGGMLGVTILSILEHAPAFQGYVHADFSPWMVVGIVATALVTAWAGAIYPARFAARIQPAEALRYE